MKHSNYMKNYMRTEERKKVVILCDWILQPKVGMQRFALQIIKHLDSIIDKTKLEIVLLIPRNTDFPIEIKNMKIERKGVINSKVMKHLWEQIVFPIYAFKNNAIGVDLTSELPVIGCKVYAIHDCIPYLYPENFKNHKIFLYLQRIKLFFCTRKKKKRIITVSETSAKDICRIYNVARKDINIIYNGWEHLEEIKEDFNVFDRFPDIDRNQYYISIGSKYQHKNYKWIIESAKLNKDNQFVIVGTDKFDQDKDILSEEKINNVIRTGYVTDGELKSLIMGCKALILPSYYEGFGIPPLEALALNKKIIVSNSSCLPEIFGRCAYYLNPDVPQTDLDDFIQGEVDSPDSLLQKYSWKKAAQHFLELLNTL